MFVRKTDDNVIVGAIFFGAFTVCVAAIAIVAGLIIVAAVVVSKRRSVVVGGAPSDTPDKLTATAP
jgi:K(+)-stimulated pyrophosphate-energized sodium pump